MRLLPPSFPSLGLAPLFRPELCLLGIIFGSWKREREGTAPLHVSDVNLTFSHMLETGFCVSLPVC